ncbi:hypothetical protein JHK82_023566 [Glycine max]|uniref:Uncharacterized protein n=1 Tax=Glycine max TaxID=3847 RepID=K7LAY5_SOYBN|nr:hypothetical protein JHK87_023512 [Glycine soja]KAG5017877.1 hypothetical protein JHK85_024013 [Glycine max]KAG5027710.1 hypothetical protein JHK86_023624 [Glycine max]KAG5138835.1 hypothetical protein JHK82_023566 [Glycine max]KAH1054838.1 hypothetical protein GYH30_023553 [Glycine max]
MEKGSIIIETVVLIHEKIFNLLTVYVWACHVMSQRSITVSILMPLLASTFDNTCMAYV